MMYSAEVKRVKQESPSQEKALQKERLDSVVTVATEMQEARRQEPAHFLLKVESFSKSKMQKYVSDEFEAGGYKWNLIVYPNGDKERNGINYISLYLSVSDAQNLPLGWEIEADFNLFVYNNISKKYESYKLAEKTCFNWLKTDSGFAQLMPLDEFEKTAKGYLLGDTCVFGAEIFITKSSGIAKRQTLSMIEETDTDFDTDTNKFTWTVKNFSTWKVVLLQSKMFKRGDVRWYLCLYPKGNGDGKEKNISLFLGVENNKVYKLAENQTVKAEFKLRIRNQLKTNHVERQST